VAGTPVATLSDITSEPVTTSLLDHTVTSGFPTYTKALSADIFVPIETGPPPPQFPQKPVHPESGVGIKESRPLQTNKFYANFFLGSQQSTVFTHPYGIHFTGTGMSISHVDRNQTVYGPGSPPSYFINPLDIRSIVLSAVELGSNTQLSTKSMREFSAVAMLAPSSMAPTSISFPVVQGQAFVTAIYSDSQPLISSRVFFSNLTFAGETAVGGTFKYQVKLDDETHWLIYLTPDEPEDSGTPPLSLRNSSTIIGPAHFSGTIQIAKAPTPDSESIYDLSAGTYATNASITASVTRDVGTYTISWTPAGLSNRYLLMFVLPHHLESMDGGTATALTNLTLQTTTKGMATALLADQMTLVENQLPLDIQFAPWAVNGQHSIPESARWTIVNAATTELAQNISAATDDDSMYWNGKALAKYAMLIYAVNSIGDNSSLAAFGLENLKDAFQIFVDNNQSVPLYYDAYWGGVTSSASYLQNNPGLDFGATYYNDHHFHYGYFVYTAAIIAYLDPSWISRRSNKAYVDTLVRDYANSNLNDEYFAFSRMFDWWHGHSWAAGLFESGDGKNEVSQLLFLHKESLTNTNLGVHK
jgi:endo-1,3(4)-beta-glucanase